MRQVERRKRHLNLNQIDMRQVLDELHIWYTEGGKNVSRGWIGTTCPFCSDESNHLGINLTAPVISCLSCGIKGNILKYLSEVTGNFDKALEIALRYSPRELKNIVIPEFQSSVTKVVLPKATQKIPNAHKDYLTKTRKYPFTLDEIEEMEELHNFQYTGPLGDWRNRIIIPVVHKFRVVSFTSCAIAEEIEIRYKHLAEEESIIPVKQHLLGLEHTNGRACCVVEGLMDKLKCGRGFLASFGTVLTPEQLKILSKFDLVVLLFDGDEAGRNAGTRTANELSPYTRVIKIDLEEGVDPDSMSTEDRNEVKRLIGINSI